MTGSARLIVISGPSGVGKGTVIAAAMKQRPELLLSVSATTREPRPGEIDGRSYHYLTRQEFLRRRAEGEMLESAEFAGNLYGTPRLAVSEALAAGRTVLLEIDLAGARQVKAAMPAAVTVFLAPPSMFDLAARLRSRGTEDPVAVDRRLQVAESELAARGEFDAVLVNTDVGDTARALLDLMDTPPG